MFKLQSLCIYCTVFTTLNISSVSKFSKILSFLSEESNYDLLELPISASSFFLSSLNLIKGQRYV